MSQFPSRSLVVRFLVFWGADLTADPDAWEATDLTDRWNTAVELQVTDGRSNGAKQAEPSEATFSLFNTDGQLTPEDARSQWWPYVDAGTPCMWIVDAGEGDLELFAGYFSSITPTWPGRSRHLSLVTVRATGIFERLGRGESPLRPPLFRAVVAGGATAHWPLDDGRDATQAASSLVAGTPLLVVGEPEMASVEGPPGARQRFPELVSDEAYSGAITAPVVLASTAGWTFDAWVLAEADELDAFATPLSWHTSGTWGAQWIVTLIRSGDDHIVNFTIVQRDGATFTVNVFDHPVYDGKWHYIRVSATQTSPTAIAYALSVDGVLGFGSTASNLTIGRPTDIKIGGFGEFDVGGTTSLSVAHPSIYGTDSPADVYAAGLGHTGEWAAVRIARLCEEEGVPCTVDAGDTAAMGPQPEATFVDLLQQCEATDLGRLSERHFGVHYRPASTLLNQTPAFTIDGSRRELREPFSPVRDLQRIRNEWRVSRPNGSEATYADRTNQQRRGRLDDGADINSELDSTLIHEASWRTRISMAPGMRYPGLGVNFGRSPRLIAPWQQVQLGDRVQAVNLLPQHPPGPLDQILEGRVQIIKGRRSWRATLITSPAAPHTVGVIEDDGLGRLDAGDTDQLAGPLTASDVAFLVYYTDGVPWVTDPAEMPLLVEIDGEQIEVATIRAVVSDAYGRTIASGWSNEPTSGQPYATSGGSASDYAVGSGVATMAMGGAANTFRTAVLPVGSSHKTVIATVALNITSAGGATITQWICGRYLDASNYWVARLDVNTAGVVTLLLAKRVAGTLTTMGSVAVGTGHASGDIWRVRIDDFGSVHAAYAWMGTLAQQPAAPQLTATDTDVPVGTSLGLLARRETGNTDAGLVVTWDNLMVTNPQAFTARSRGVNSVFKAHLADAPVRVVDAFVLS